MIIDSGIDSMPEFDRQKWNAKYQEPANISTTPSAVLQRLVQTVLPQDKDGKTALEIAAGGGRNGIYLAQQGYAVTLCDISAVGLALASQRATEAGVRVITLLHDLELDPAPVGKWDLIISVCYLYRPLYSAFSEMLAPGGHLVVIQPTKTNLERHDRPPAPFLLEPGELPTLAQNLKVVHYEEGWLEDGRHDAVLVATRAVY